MNGYRSLDGGAVIRLKIANYHDVIEMWSKALSKSVAIEPRKYADDRFYSVVSHDLKQGLSFYRYQADVLDSCGNCLYSMLFDIRGAVKIEVRYAAQRDSMKLNLEYRKLFDHLNIRILEEKVARVDLAITIEKKPSDVIAHIIDGRYNSLLNRSSLVVYGAPATSVRIGNLKNVEVAVYDKYDELLCNSAKLSYQLKLDDFEAHFKESQEVTRIEYRLSRTYLRNIGIFTPEDVNNSVFDLYATMQQKYFMPTVKVPDGHHALKVSPWWDELPPLVEKCQNQERRIMFTTFSKKNIFHPSPIWSHSYEMMMSRAKGYLASIVSSMARVSQNVDTALNIVMSRVVKDDFTSDVRLRASSRFALE